MKSLPRSLDDIRGLRAARWIRELTAGQVDRFGPDAQREQQDRAIERHELVDTGISWLVAHSGRTIASTSSWTGMLAAAGDRYDVLVVGYVSRFARNLETAVTARTTMHQAGAAILFADDGILTSDEDSWERWAREAVEAEAYSRRLGKRIREGYAAKRRRLADPAGHAPFGFTRTGPGATLVPDPSSIDNVYKIYNLSAEGMVDREVAAAVGLPLPTVRGILRNPIYAGRLTDGTPTRFAAPVPSELWQAAQVARDRRRRQRGQRAVRRPYALPMLACEACGRRLVGDNGRYRHLDVCDTFAAAATNGRRRAPGQHRIPLGRSYPAATYEAGVAATLERVAVGADVAVHVISSLSVPERDPDRMVLARIERERQAAGQRLVRDRDQARFTATMARLDAEEQDARASTPLEQPTAAEAADYLRGLGKLWAETSEAGRRRLAEVLFERIDVLGIRRMRIVPTRHAIEAGIAAAFAGSAVGTGEPGRSRANRFRLLVQLTPGVTTSIDITLPHSEPLRVVRSA